MILYMKFSILHARQYGFPLLAFQKPSCLSELYLNNEQQIKSYFEILKNASNL